MICGACSETFIPVAVFSVLVAAFVRDCLWEADTEKGPYPTLTFASVLEASRLLESVAVLPLKLSSTFAARTNAVG